ncbi:MAG: hypothetical protein ABIR32_15215 [Ilumatobacteraceae bacterium]
MNTMRLGVTGHRSFLHHADIVASVDSVLDRVLDVEPPVGVVVVTSLAEGADRLVAEMVLQRGGMMQVILPLPAADYSTDFETVDSRAEFDTLLDRAESVEITIAPDTTREAAYEAAGHAMVAASDIVIALWDGTASRGRGGTAEIIQHALDHNVPVEIVLVER